MKTTSRKPSPIRPTGFTLIEMIGVLAIMAILAATITPNALRIIERTAVRSEADNLHAFGEQLKLYVCDTGIIPNSGNWDVALAPYASANPIDLLYNRRQKTTGPGAIQRLFVPDLNIATTGRAMFLSSMREGIALPTAGNVQTNFQTIWNWNSADTNPLNLPPPGLAAWIPALREFLVIERVNLRSIPELQFELRNHSTTTNASYRVMGISGNTIPPGVVIVPRATAVGPVITDGSSSPKCRLNQRINLYDGTGTLNYSYVVGTIPKNFVFDGTSWIPQ